MNIPFHILEQFKAFTYVDNLVRVVTSEIIFNPITLQNDISYWTEYNRCLPSNSPEYLDNLRLIEMDTNILESAQRDFAVRLHFLNLMSNLSDFQINSYRLFKHKYSKLPHLVTRCYTKIRSNQKKTANIRRRIESIFWDIVPEKKENVYFVTYTFSNDTLENTTAMTRHTYIARYCKKYSYEYVANIDFGGTFGREHYHALMILNPDSAKQLKEEYSSKMGFIYIEVVRSENDTVKLAKYINKLVNHSVKSTADRIIYSRFKI